MTMFPGRSIRWKMMFVTMTTALIALVFAGVALLVYDIRAFRTSRLDDLGAQADIVGRASAPALVFADPDAARANLALLHVRPAIRAAALYDESGALFATWAASDASFADIPRTPPAGEYVAAAGEFGLFRPLVENGERRGTVFLLARDDSKARVLAYVGILGTVLIASLGVALALSAWLQRAMTQPVLSIAAVARRVMERRDFSLRAPRTTQDEVGVLADAFNGMLVEVERRAAELEASYRSLEEEMRNRRVAEAALRKADRRKDEFLATLAHELRNPLAPIRNGLQILRMRPDDPVARAEAQKIMERQLGQMVRLVDDLLDVSRITTGKIAITPAPVDLRAIVRSAIDTARPAVDALSHHLEVDVPPEPVPVLGDATRLAQVVANLLNNAAKYTPPRGHIRLALDTEGASARIVVTDDGIGIAPDMREAIFDMFVQADSSIERAQAGLGVGLSLARRLVELHGGRLAVASDGPGKGSAFTVTLPLAAGNDLASSETGPAVAPHAAAPRRVLVVDDNRDYASTIELILRASGHDVAVAHDAHAAVDLARRFAPDVALLDIGMPGTSGYELARRLRGMAETAHTTLVAVTGWGQQRDLERARDAGFDHHLVKPAEPEVIRGIVARSRATGVARSAVDR
jgi:signal transduction histidine kinase/ActR/RegA family two-component response regulator